MKTEKNILIAFILNLGFSIFEFFGGIFTGSVAIVSDAVHDIGDAASIGTSYILEKKSKKQPDAEYTYGYARYSVMGSVITTLILLVGSAAVIWGAVGRMINPVEINYNGMIIFAIIGVIVNLGAAFVTREGDSLNQKAVNLHMLEDVLGWIVVLVGAIVMKFSDFVIIDPILSIGAAVFILINAIKNLKAGDIVSFDSFVGANKAAIRLIYVDNFVVGENQGGTEQPDPTGAQFVKKSIADLASAIRTNKEKDIPVDKKATKNLQTIFPS